MTDVAADLVKATGGRLLQGDPLAQFRGATIDSRIVHRGNAFVAIRGERTDGHRFVRAARAAGAATAIVEAGTPRRFGLPAAFPLVQVRSSIRALQAAGTAHRRRFRLPVIGVTGSNGKTSVKDLAAALLAGAVGDDAVLATHGNLNNHLGVPLMLLELEGRHRVAVLELAMNHRGEIAHLSALSAPTSGVILNAGRAHVGAFGSVAGVARAKAELIEALPAGGWAILNADDPNVWARRGQTLARVAGFGSRAGDVRAEKLSFDREGCAGFLLCTPAGNARVRTQLPGAHGALNAAAAAAIGWTHGADLRAIVRGLEGFLPRARMRLERKALRNGAIGIVDCYNANPDSYFSAFDYLKALRVRHPVLVAGEMLELGRHGPGAHRAVGRAAAALSPSCLVGVGRLARPLVAAARRAGLRRAAWVRGPLEAESLVADSLVPGAVVLFKASRKVGLERLVDRLAAGRAKPGAKPRAYRAV